MMLKKTVTLALSISLLLQSSLPYADNIKLPDIGTAAASTLSIGQEIEMGDYYMRMLRASAPIINDPVLNQYINDLGNKLVLNADSVQTPFHFHILQSNVLNAFAFFGGNVVVHSRLILDTDNESQLASVLSHEIGHVTQSHLARAMEFKSKSNPYFWGAALGSILLALASPEAGIAAMAGTLAGSTQSTISFTQSNEQEADWVGLRTLNKSGFDPMAASDFLQKLADQARYMSKPPEILLTHPLPDSRLSDIRNRTQQYKKRELPPSLGYYLAKARLVVLFGENKNSAQTLMNDYQKLNNAQSKTANIYANALLNYKNKFYQNAQQELKPLLDNDPNNIWYIDLMTDIDVGLKNYTTAINRLQTALKKNSDSASLQLNLANVYIKNGDYQKATSLLHRYTYSNSDDMNGWDLLILAYNGLHSRAQAMSAQAELLALQGQLEQAIQLLTNSKKQINDNQLANSRVDARITQLEKLKNRYAAYR